mgnify:CR=1 FL=1
MQTRCEIQPLTRLTRPGLNLPTSLLAARPSLDLLRQLELAQLLSVPFESTILHVPSSAWTEDPDRAIQLGESGESVALGEAAFDRIVRERKGGYCFSLNSVFAALLRHWFRVSDVAARVYGHLDQDPAAKGWSWAPTSHHVLIAGWDGEEGMWILDGGFGGGQSPYPCVVLLASDGGESAERLGGKNADDLTSTRIPLQDGGQPALGETPCPRYKVLHSALPTNDPAPAPSTLALDEPKTWTCYREVTPPAGPTFWSPYYTFLLQNVAHPDFIVMNHYNSTHPSAVFKNFFLSTKLHEDGSRTTLYFKEPMVAENGEMKGERCAKLQRTSLAGTKLREEWVAMKVRPIKAVLEHDFGFVFG